MNNRLFSFSDVLEMPLMKKGKNTFEWTIESYTEYTTHASRYFNIGEHQYSIYADRKDCSSPTKNLCEFRLSTFTSSILPVSYTFSIVDHVGQDFFTTHGVVLKESPDERTLMIISDTYLIAYNLIDGGTLTVRCTLKFEPDAQEGSHPNEAEASNVAEFDRNINPSVTNDSSTNTDGEQDNLLETLSKDFSTFYESKADTDCVLRVSEAKFSVHRAVLSARSSVFSAMFHHDTAENRSGEVNILDGDPTSFNDLLYYVYSGKIRGLTADTATSIYTAADKYDLQELRAKSLQFLKLNLTMENFCEAAVLAHTHGEVELEELVVCFIEEKLDDVLETNSWQQFLKDKSLLANKLLTSALKAAKNKFKTKHQNDEIARKF